jgi:hypothetical protein
LFAFIVLKNDDGQGRRIRGSDTQWYGTYSGIMNWAARGSWRFHPP